MEPGRLTVSTVSGNRDERDFHALPRRLYREDSQWVSPLPGEERAVWDPRRNPALRARWAARFLARRGDRMVGRVAAFFDPAFHERWIANAGFFGFFECEDDRDAARGLFDAAEDALRARGVKTVLGPVALSTHGEVGALVEGFDSPPMILSPYNARHLPGLIEAAGYTVHTDYHSYRWLPSMRLSPAAERLMAAARGGATGGVVVRPVDTRRWDAECRTIHRLYNECFDHVWGFVPMTWEEFETQAAQFRPVLRPELVLVAEQRGDAVGFALALPDVNEALRPLRGRLWPFGWFRLLRSLPRIHGVRFILLGVRPGFTGRGIAVRLSAGVADGCRRLGVTHGEASLVRSSNDEVKRVIAALQSTPLKTYRLFQKRIGAS
jgi:GNAT superfamily N-acetyltransferase